MNDTPLLLVLDGNNLALRAHGGHRIKNEDGEWDTLRTSDGRPTGALYGLINTFLSLVRSYQPSHVLWTFDWGKSEVREAMDENYKGNRTKDSERDDILPQYNSFWRFLDLVGVKHHKEERVEADDIMAAAAHKFSPHMKVLLVTADHDMRQLISENVMVLQPSMGKRGGEKIWTEKTVEDYYGLPPHRLPEVWAIQGDAGDNIKGVPTYGPVRSLKALQEHGDLPSVIQNDPKVAPYAEMVARNYEMILLTGEHAEFPIEIEECVFTREYDRTGLLSLFTEYEFRSFLDLESRNRLWTRG